MVVQKYKRPILIGVVAFILFVAVIVVICLQNNRQSIPVHVDSQGAQSIKSSDASSSADSSVDLEIVKGEIHYDTNIDHYLVDTLPPQELINFSVVPQIYPNGLDISKTKIHKISDEQYIVKDMRTAEDGSKSAAFYISNQEQLPGIDLDVFKKLNPTKLGEYEIRVLEQKQGDDNILSTYFINEDGYTCLLVLRNGTMSDVEYIFEMNFADEEEISHE